MKKYWITLLLAIAATQAIAGEKEYTVKACEFLIGPYFRTNDCNDCEVVEGAKQAFKASKQLKSVMQIFTKADGTSKSSVIENCKIFDENNFECTNATEADRGSDWYFLGSIIKLIVSNGKWEYSATHYGSNYDVKKGKKNASEMTQSYSCGYEIKNSFNFFK